MPGRLAASSSSLYAKNLYAFLEILIDKSAKALAVKWDDEIVKATALTRDGAVIHPNFQPKTAQPAATPWSYYPPAAASRCATRPPPSPAAIPPW